MDNDISVKYLEEIEPFDDIDKACKEHDICYLNNGFGNYQCDLTLFASLSSNYEEDSCKNLASTLAFIMLSVPHSGTRSALEDVATSFKMVTIGAVAVPVIVMGMAPSIAIAQFTDEESVAGQWHKCTIISQQVGQK